ncbi:hypothetical protein JYU15_01645 [bacterium AH-315-I18]|nr:hypothetical protein [bacterium AH-315-I18]
MTQIRTGYSAAPITRSKQDILSRITEVVLLAGTVHPTSLHQQIGRSALDLPVDESRSILNHWQDHITHLAGRLQRDFLNTRIMIDWTATAPITAWSESQAAVSIERDPLELRGTGGVLHDLAKRHDDQDYLLVISANQLLFEPLDQLVVDMASLGGDVQLVSYEDGTPGGMTLCRCGALRDIAPIGFVDLKEQALPVIARSHQTMVLRKLTTDVQPIRKLSDYLQGLRRMHGFDDTDLAGQPGFRLVEAGAIVDPQASVCDAVVLRGAKIDKGAVVARSLVLTGGHVKAGQVVVDQLVTMK